MTEEEWRPIPSVDGYEASSKGRIRSVDRVIQCGGSSGSKTMRVKGRILKPSSSPKDEYLRLSLGRTHRNKTVHRLVCEAFHGEPAEWQVARHLNDIRSDNRAENLSWGTDSDNMLDARRNGTWNNQNSVKEECKYGHPLAGENLYLTRDRRRKCRECDRRTSAEYRAKNIDQVRERDRIKAWERRMKEKS